MLPVFILLILGLALAMATHSVLWTIDSNVYIALAHPGREIFFSDWHLAPKFFKVVADSKNVDRHFQRQTKRFFNAVSVLDRPSKIKLGIRSLTCYKVDTRMDDIQLSSSPKYKMASSYRSRWMCCARFGNKLNEEVCRVFPIWRLISGFGRHSETFSRIGACIRRNFTPCHLKSCNFYVF